MPLALLVDGDADSRQMYVEFLRMSACDVDEAEDGREALARALTKRPDIIVTETRLPGLNGFDLCSVIRHDEATRAIPVIFLTADAMPKDVEKAYAVGADEVLTKPCLPEQLLDRIQRSMANAKERYERVLGAQDRLEKAIGQSDSLIAASRERLKRVSMSKALDRRDTTTPPIPPPSLVCPTCDQALKYVKSHVGGVSAKHFEQWDYFECPAGCGEFQYRERTKKLRKV